MYLLDANTYIEAKNRYYQIGFCPAYWQWLEQQFQLGMLGSVSTVYDELARKGDELSDWVHNHRHHFHDISAEEIQLQMAEVAQYVADLPNKDERSIANFLSGADPWLIARASIYGETIVTHESLVDNASKKVKIPNICAHFGVPHINTFELLNSLEARFVLVEY